MMKKILCLIPARGGSKRIPRKNLIRIAGKPMIQYVFDAVKQSKFVNRIVLTTEDEEIAQFGRSQSVEVPFKRPQELAEDTTPMVPVLQHALKWLKENEGYWPDYVLMIQPSSPAVKAEQIDEAIALIQHKQVDSVETVIEAPTIFHPYNVRFIDQSGFTHFLMPEKRAEHSIESGKRPRIYARGNLFVFKPENLFETETMQGRTSASVVIDRESAFDVDDSLDLSLAQHLFENFTDKIEHAKKVIAWAVKNYKNIGVACSFGKDSLVVAHLAREVCSDVPVFYAATIYKPQETLEYAVRINQALNLDVKVYMVARETPEVFKQAGIETILLPTDEFKSALIRSKESFGKALYETEPDLCCQLLKVKATQAAVRELDAWVSGLRRDEGHTRKDYKEVEKKGDLVKINPILEWSELDVWRYLALNHIEPNPLYKKGYRSLGCAPCSKIIADGQQERDGRWQGTEKAGGECGIHTKHLR